jgi:hypothetical protein
MVVESNIFLLVYFLLTCFLDCLPNLSQCSYPFKPIVVSGDSSSVPVKIRNFFIP